MNPNTNRRNGLKHEGRVRKWFLDAGYNCLNLASNSYGDLIVYDSQELTHLLEVKKVTSNSPTENPGYYPSRNPKQRDALKRQTRAWYCISFYGLRPNQLPVTRFVPASAAPLVIRSGSGIGWPEFLRFLGTPPNVVTKVVGFV